MTAYQVQCLLSYLGYYTGTIDGDWGKLSRNACTSFQQDRGITVDGLPGPETEEALRHAVASNLKKATDISAGDFWDHIRYWRREEFRCRCGQYHEAYCSGFPVEPDQTLVELVDDLRAHFGRPGHPSSGIRCSRHNADQAGAVPNSRHLLGKALDFYIEGVTGDALCARATADPRCRYSYVISGNYVHVDVC